MSFNKVDDALQSVGISMKTAEGQFLSMEDVILELSSKWNELSSVQQRYVATQFAGNRQQSRFLALVSNEELLKKSLKTAQNSEGAGDLQTLKTLDSLETKIQQVQTAWQQFYTTLGAEDIWKGSLDGIKNLIDNLNSMPKLFGKVPLEAINIAAIVIKLVKTVLTKGLQAISKIIKDAVNDTPRDASAEAERSNRELGEKVSTSIADGIKSKIKDIEAAKKAALEAAKFQRLGELGFTDSNKQGLLLQAQQRVNKGGFTNLDEANNFRQELFNGGLVKSNKKFSNLDKANASILSIVLNNKEVLDLLSQTEEETNAIADSSSKWQERIDSVSFLFGDKMKNAVSTIGTLMSGIAMTMDVSTNSAANLQSVMIGIGGVMSALNTSNPLLMGAQMALSVYTMIATLIKNNSLEAQVERAEKVAKEASVEEKRRKNEQRDFESAFDNYETLKEKRYESTEANNDFLESQQNLAETYPELIKGFDSTGEAIIDAAAQERTLAELRLKTAKATATSAEEEAKVQTLRRQQSQKEAEERLQAAFLGDSGAGWGSLDDLARAAVGFKNGGFGETLTFEDLTEGSRDDVAAKIAKVLTSGYGPLASTFDEDGNLETISAGAEYINFTKVKKAYKDFLQSGDYTDFLIALEENTSVEVYNALLEAFQADEAVKEYQKATIDTTTQNKLTENARKKDLSSQIAALYMDEMDFLVDNSTLSAILTNILASEDFIKGTETASEWIGDNSSIVETIAQAFNDFYNSLTEERQELLEKMLNDDAVSFDNIAQTFGLTDNSEVYKAVEEWYKQSSKQWNELITNRFEELGLDEFEGTIENKSQYKALTKAIDKYEALVEQGYLDYAKNYLQSFQNLYDFIESDSSSLSKAQQDAVQSLIASADLTSHSGFFELEKSLRDYYEEIGEELPEDISNYLTQMKDSIVDNLSLSFSVLTDSVVSKIEELNEVIGKITDSLDFSEALDLYSKITTVDGNKELDFNSLFKIDENDPTKYILRSADATNTYLAAQAEIYRSEAEALEKRVEQSQGLLTKAYFDINGDTFSFLDNFKASTINAFSGKTGFEALDEYWEYLTASSLYTDEVLSVIESLNLKDAFFKYYQDSDLTALQEAISKAADDSQKEQQKINLAIAQLDKIAPIQSAIAIGEYIKALSILEDSNLTDEEVVAWKKYINTQARDAYSQMAQDFAKGGAELVKSNAASYGIDLKTIAEDFTYEKALEKLTEDYSNEVYSQSQYNEARAALEKANREISNALNDSVIELIDNSSSITEEIIQNYANAKGLDYQKVIESLVENEDGTYAASLATIQDFVEQAYGKDIPQKVEESLQEYFSSIVDIFNSGIEGSASATDIGNLQNALGVEIEFTKTAEGLKTTRESNYKILAALEKQDSVFFQSAVKDYAEELEEEYKDIFEIAEKIVKLQKKIDAEPDDARKSMLLAELAVAKEIEKTLKDADSTYNFMNRDLPSGFDDPLSAWEGIGTAFNVLNGEDFQNGKMDFTNFYNMITFMGDETLRAAGVFTDDSQTAAELISAAAKSLVNIDGETFVDLSKIGTAFNLGAEGMKDGLSKGIKTLAQNQIDMLDAEIMLLETVVKTQDVFKNLSGEDGVFDLSEIEFLKIDANMRLGDHSYITDFMTQYFSNVKIGEYQLGEILNDAGVYKKLDEASRLAVLQLFNMTSKALQEANYDETGKLINDDVLQNAINTVLTSFGSGPIKISLDAFTQQLAFEKDGNGDYTSSIVKKLNTLFEDISLSSAERDEIAKKINDALLANPTQTITIEDIIQSFLPEGVDSDRIKEQLLAKIGVADGLNVPVDFEFGDGVEVDDSTITFGASISEESQTQIKTFFSDIVDMFKDIAVSFAFSGKKEKSNTTESAPVSPLAAGFEKFGEVIHNTIDKLNSSTKLDSLTRAIDNLKGASSVAFTRVDRITNVLKKIPTSKTINLLYKITVDTIGGAGEIVKVNGNKASGNTTSGSIFRTTQAKGNVALSKGTLMGELGPELVVSNGHYFTVGENGAEFVNLADDAIVFNHLQTQRLLSSGSSTRGTPITNEKKATAFASGNAMASAATALSELKNIRSMWQALLDASSKDLGTKAGSGGGGGGGNNDIAGYEYDLERWYNMLRQIAKLEQQITYEQAKRENMVSGYKYVDSLERELKLLEKQLKVEKQLASLQYDYYLKRMEDVNKSAYSKIFTYDEQGLMQYVDGKNRGLDALATLQATDENGVLKMSAKQQLNYITKTLGISLSDLKYKSDGSLAETDADKVQVFFDNVDSLMSELDELYDSYHEHAEKIEDLTSSQNEILQEYVDNQRSLEDKLLKAIEDREQEVIDKLTDQKEALEEASQSYIDGLNEALNKEQELYNKNQTNNETATLQRRLAILQRSGGSASEIKSLQDQIDSRLQDAYFQAQQDQIDAIQEASNNQLEKLQTQIDLMTETLEYQKENGLLWQEVYEMMNQWSPEQMLQFIEQYTKSYRENSALENQESSKESLKEAEIWVAKRNKDSQDKAWKNYYTNANYSEEIKKANADAAQNAFNEAYVSGGVNAGAAAADKIFSSAGSNNTEAEEEQQQPSILETIKGKGIVKTNGSNLYIRKGPGTNYKTLGKYKNGSSVVLTGYKNKWYRVDYNGKTGYVFADYIKTSDKKKLPAFKDGGLVDFTGPAWVDGSKSKPEAFLSAEDTALLKSKVFNGDTLKSLIAAFEEITRGSRDYSNLNNSGVIIENATVNIQPGVISNDYDAKRAGEAALEEMLKIARKTTNRVVSR